jgi:cyclopropane fatty-acyl-phospholipid synthase-like methyltransferase
MNTLKNQRFRFIWHYLRGNAPWNSGIVPPEICAWIESAQVSGIAPGRALDLGCGTGTTSVYLAAHGWKVVGVDFASNAIWRARRKARHMKVSNKTRFYSADVSRLDFLHADPPFDLAVDIGCLHLLMPDERTSYAEHLIRLTHPGATYLLYAFMPSLNRAGRQIGIDPDGLQALLCPAFTLEDLTIGQDSARPVPSGWYTFRRTE